MSLRLVFLSLIGTGAVNAALPGQYPQQDVAAPTNETWTNSVNAAAGPGATVYKNCVNSNHWALTFDDGPTIDATNTLLNTLDNYKVKATFFVVGSRVFDNPEMLKKVYEKGHQVALHSWSHADMATLTADQVLSEVLWNYRAVYEAIQVYPTMFRFPFGSYNDQALQVLGKLGLEAVQWSQDTNDFYAQTAPFDPLWITNNVTNWSKETIGQITLEHDLHNVTVGFVPPILEILTKTPWKLVTISECLGKTAYVQKNLASSILGLGPGQIASTLNGPQSNPTASKSVPNSNSVTSDAVQLTGITFALLTFLLIN